MSIGWVYFIEAEGTGRIKIGHSHDPDWRLAQLRTVSPVPLKPLGVISGTVWREQSIHRRFGRLWTHGEWFKSGDDLMDFIAAKARPWPKSRRELKVYDDEDSLRRQDREEDEMMEWARMEVRLQLRAKIRARRRIYQG